MTTPELPADTALDYLQGLREDVIWKVSGLPEHEQRRPMTHTGTNLLGLVKHLAASEFGYFQMCFDRPVPDREFLRPDADPQGDFFATEQESAEDLLQLYGQAVDASNRTVAELGLDAVGRVPWWGGAEIGMRRAIVHMTVETARHLGHLDIVREQLDGRAGLSEDGTNLPSAEQGYWSEHWEHLMRLSKLAEAEALAHQRGARG